MKTYLKSIKKSAALFGIAALLSLFSSCIKDNNNYVAPPVALVSVFQASTALPALDVYFNNNQVNWSPVTYQTGLAYIRAYTGLRTFNFYTYGEKGLLFSDTATLKANNAYSIFLSGTPNKTDFILLKDTVNQPAAGKANIRFVDLSPDAPAVDLVLNDTVKVANKSYKGFSTFIPVTGDKLYTIKVRQQGTNTVLATLNNVTLNANLVYTIMLTGLSSGSSANNNALAINYVTNAYF